MISRKEYEEICDKTFALAGDAQGTRIQIDLLLDIRELLAWLRDDILLQRIVEEREEVARNRMSNILIDKTPE